MKLFSSLILAAAMSLSAGTAFAACPDKSASTTTDTTRTAGIAKDGSTMPLAGAEGGGDKNLAMSQQDVEAQQKGDKTAAAKADDACKD